MGKERSCLCEWDGKSGVGTARLETDVVSFRGDFNLDLPFKDLVSITVEDEWLQLATEEGLARFELGPEEAARWAGAILNPKVIVDKVDLQGGMKVSVFRIKDEEFLDDLRARDIDVSHRRRKGSAAIFVGVEGPKDLGRLDDLEELIARDGAIWTVSPKGRKDFNETHIYEHMRGLGLKDVKTARFSDTHTANKFVIPRERR